MLLKLELKPIHTLVVEHPGCYWGERTVDDRLTVQLLIIHVDTACSSKRLRLVWYLETNICHPLHLCRLTGSVILSAFSCIFSLLSLLSYTFPSLFSPLLPSFAYLSCFLPFFIEHKSPSHFCLLLLPPLFFCLLFLFSMAQGAGVLSSGSSGSFPLSLTISHMSIRKRQCSPSSPSPSWACRDVHMKHHLLHSSRRWVSILLLLGGRAQWVPGGNVACLDNLIY